ncbi:hypothetical protein Zmor_001609 [Zophobas morio]|uniref:Uncharacterized protein n=1 Tax=Zophobas morio TaxID=2755281 RepID=A0AA38MPF3_9CUCU|nr:hypothetical protein Zmor_001609 [Zophobas morio]
MLLVDAINLVKEFKQQANAVRGDIESKEEAKEFTNIQEDRTEYIEESESTINEFLNEVEEIENEVEETENEVENIDINNEETGANQQNVNEQIVETEDEEEDQNEATNRYNLRNRSCLRQPRKLEVYDMDSSYEEEDCETALICSSILDDNLSYQEAVTGPNKFVSIFVWFSCCGSFIKSTMGKKYCAINFCTNSSATERKSFHRLPTGPTKQEWLKRLGKFFLI